MIKYSSSVELYFSRILVKSKITIQYHVLYILLISLQSSRVLDIVNNSFLHVCRNNKRSVLFNRKNITMKDVCSYISHSLLGKFLWLMHYEKAHFVFFYQYVKCWKEQYCLLKILKNYLLI